MGPPLSRAQERAGEGHRVLRSVKNQTRLYPDRPIAGVLAVVRRGDRVLLAQRSVPPGIGKWGFPGGTHELGESVQGCAQRELREETGVIADPRSAITVLDFIRSDADDRIEAHFVLVCVLLEWRSGEGEAIEDATAIGWFTPEEAEKLSTFPDVVPVMRMALG